MLRPRSVATLLFALTACTSELPYRWTDRDLGIQIHSDFSSIKTELLLSGELRQRVRALTATFGTASLDDLHVFVHDHDYVPTNGDARIGGWHDNGEIHLLAALFGGQLGLPDPMAKHTFGHELVHALVRRAGMKPMRWLEEGLCEVLGGAPVDGDGRLILMPLAPREFELRQLRAEHRWLDLDELLAFGGGYPSDHDKLRPMYAEATSFVAFLLRDHRYLDADAIRSVVECSADKLRAAWPAWVATIDTEVSALLLPFANDPDVGVRRSLANSIARREGTQWWQLASTLLVDDDVEVRKSARIMALYQLQLDADGRAKASAWAAATNPRLRCAGRLALLQNGDLDAAIAFLRELGGTPSEEMWLPLLWLTLLAPNADGSRRTAPAPDLANDSAAWAAHCQRMADELDALRATLVWDAKSRRWQRRA